MGIEEEHPADDTTTRNVEYVFTETTAGHHDAPMKKPATPLPAKGTRQ